MKISYNWLLDYLSGAGIEGLTPTQTAEILTSTGLEVDSLERVEAIPGGLEGVVVGEVLTCIDHPDSDHLHITTVNVGTAEPLQVVCGAPNVAAGQKVLVATVGTTLGAGAESFKIKKSKIRGIESHGMICAEDELGIGTAHDGIMVLDPGVAVGTPAAKYLNLEGDWMIEIGLTPNRVDGASHYGVARDLAAWLNTHGRPTELLLPSVEGFEIDNHSLEIPVEVRDPEGAPRYAGVTISGLKQTPSPEWLQRYLRAIGLNPHNNLVDITNFVLHEVGQPLHAFDADRIAGGRIIVDTCPEGTPFVTLDGVERKLSAEDLVICDGNHAPMCIAGVMGGLESGVGEGTTAIFLESAYFNSTRVRKTARRHGINSDASFLFERGVDPDKTIWALRRAALMYKELAGGEVSSDVVDIYPEPMTPFRFDFSLVRAARLIGKEIPRDEVMQILAALEVTVEVADHVGGDVLHVAVPRYRVDVQREADLVEEILRIYGYNNVEVPTRMFSSLAYAPAVDRDSVQNGASEFLTSNGFTEIMSNSLTRAAYYEGLKSYPPEALVKILNPLSIDLAVMRQTLLFNALEAVQRNTNHRNADLKLYEFGNGYSFDAAKMSGRTEANLLAPYKEIYRLGIAITGLDTQPSWNSPAAKSSFYTLSGIARRLVGRFGLDLDTMRGEATVSDLFSEGITYRLGEGELLQMGAVSPALLGMFDIKTPVWFLEMDFSRFAEAAARVRTRASELARFPSVRRDLALLVDKGVTFKQLRDIAFATERKLLREVTLFDVYEGDKLPAGKKSYALGFTLEDRAATLTDAAIDRTMNNLVKQYENQTDAKIR